LHGGVFAIGQLRKSLGSQVLLTFLSLQGFSNLVLEGRCPAEFSSNPDQTHLPVTFL